MAVNRKIYWHRDTQSAGELQLGITTNGWNNANNITGVWNSTLSAYEFEMDTSDTAIYDPLLPYSMWEDSVELADEIMLGDADATLDLTAHIVNVTAHSATGGVVGASKAQTLTNKTIDGDDNTLQDIAGSSMKSDTTINVPIRFKPNSGTDSEVNVRASDASSVTMRASNAAVSADRTLNIITDELALANSAGSKIKITGLAAGAATGEAVRFDEFDALDTRVGNLEVGGTWSGSPVCWMRLQTRHRWSVRVSFGMTVAANRTEVARYEIYWAYQSFGDLSAGATSASDLANIRSVGEKIIIRAGEANLVSLANVDAPIQAIVVAFDQNGTAYNSDEGSITPIGVLEPRRDGAGEIVELIVPMPAFVSQAAGATTNTAAEYVEYTQSDTSVTIKDRREYRHTTKNKTMRMAFYAKAGTVSGEDGWVQLDIRDKNASDTLKKRGSYLVEFDTVGTSYPTVPQEITIDLSTGLTDGTLYEIEVSIFNSGAGAYDTVLRGDMFFELIQQVSIF